MYVEWKDEYSVGVPRFDEQHKKLCAVINELHDGIVSGRGLESQKNVFKGLIECVLDHFADEERLMREYGYPDVTAHFRNHQQFRDTLEDFIERHLKGSEPLTMDTLGFLVKWLERHMTGADKKYQRFFNSKGIT